MAGSYEVEVKVPINDEKAIEHAILQAGGKRLNTEIQSDLYYDHPCRSFSQTDESVRIRIRKPVEDYPLPASEYAPIELTYKGPKVDRTTKTRLEYTSGISDFDAISSILQHTGFKLVATIKKHRVFYNFEGITVSIDNVEGVGRFIELELAADNEEEMQYAKDRILSVVKHLGLDSKRMVRESYLELYLAHGTT
ncbi:MAG: class IV adenylate cyclase [Candidatus Thorarchaeota archaeon]|nr:class IV adenylate cyclase [Candidatus Thorarchaeota archaeon]